MGLPERPFRNRAALDFAAGVAGTRGAFGGADTGPEVARVRPVRRVHGQSAG